MNSSYDLKHRILNYQKRSIHIYFLSSLCSDLLISLLIEGIEEKKGENLINCLNLGDVTTLSSQDVDKIDYSLASGNVVVVDGSITYLIDAKNYPNRSIEQPDTEKSVRGSKDGFNESLLNNTGLIRRRIKMKDLIFHRVTLGTENPIDIAVVYIKSKVNKDLLSSVLNRLEEIKTEELIMSDRALEELLVNQNYNPYPLVRYSERPDIVSTHIHHGHIAIICDTSSSVMMIPTTLFGILEHVEEHRQPPLVGTFIRVIRYFAVFLSVYLMPLFMLFSCFLRWDIEFFVQVFIVEIFIELLRIATIHTPEAISNAMGMIAAILLGQFAVELGLFSKEILLTSCIGAVCGFATPNYELSLTNKYIKLMMIICVGFFNLFGFLIFNIFLLIYFIRLKPFGISYLYPLIPFNKEALFNVFIRKPKSKKS